MTARLPSAAINLDALAPKKNNHEAVSAKARAMGIGGKSTMGESEIELKYLPGRQSVLFFEPTTPLKPGE